MVQSSFTKGSKLPIIDHIFILLFILDALYIGSITLHLNLNLPIYATISLYTLFLLAIKYPASGGKFTRAQWSVFRGNIPAMWGWLNKSPHSRNFLTAFMP